MWNKISKTYLHSSLFIVNQFQFLSLTVSPKFCFSEFSHLRFVLRCAFLLILFLLLIHLNGFSVHLYSSTFKNSVYFLLLKILGVNLPLFSTVVASSIFMFNILDGTTVENKGKLILTEIFPSVQKHDIFQFLEFWIIFSSSLSGVLYFSTNSCNKISYKLILVHSHKQLYKKCRSSQDDSSVISKY